MAISLTSTNTSGAVNVNGVDVLTADAGGNVSLRTGGIVQTLPTIAGSQALGVGQTWQNVTANRVAGTTYTNTTGKPISFIASFGTAGTSQVTPTIGGTALNPVVSYPNMLVTFFGVIPTGSTYSFAFANVGAFTSFHELRA